MTRCPIILLQRKDEAAGAGLWIDLAVPKGRDGNTCVSPHEIADKLRVLKESGTYRVVNLRGEIYEIDAREITAVQTVTRRVNDPR